MSKSVTKGARFISPAEENREIMRFSPIETSPAWAFVADLDTTWPTRFKTRTHSQRLKPATSSWMYSGSPTKEALLASTTLSSSEHWAQ
ncbi:hypothetical protein HMPREF1979_00248 [Actinomyces johnsonii F0542]|uniref:Uncharacterized protein n=1 Tax=Actinomyces johnsonii F0542 TaxID=1321818 RepID=U1QW15_9ACTO|nr:hypothetical protein HMPREF1979_00248 [Actinomyces johnsonii F0542]